MKKNKSRMNELSICLLLVFFLSPVLFFPISTDLSVFVSAGKTILNGGKLYVDFIDIKQPLIYQLFAAIQYIFGSAEFSLRLFDFCLQLITCYYIYIVTAKNSNKLTAVTAMLLYAVSYSILGFNQTLQVESFTGILILFIIQTLMKEKLSFKNLIFLGLIFGILSGLKITFSILPIFVIVYLFFDSDFTLDKKILKISLISFFWLFSFLLTCLPLADKGVFSSYINVLKYLSYYSSLPPLNAETFGVSIKNLGIFFGDNLSLFILIGFSTAILYYFKNKEKSKFENILLLVLISMFLSIVAERKFYTYHFIRLYIPLMIFSAYGTIEIYKIFKSVIHADSFIKKIISVLFLILFLSLSPLVRFVNLQKYSYYYITDKAKYNNIYERSEQSVIIRNQHLAVASYINSRVKKNDGVILISTASSVINYFLKDVRISKFSLSCFYLGVKKINEFDEIFKDELTNSRWLVIQTNDGNYHAFGHYNSSYQAILSNQDLKSRIFNNFEIVNQLGHFLILKKIGT